MTKFADETLTINGPDGWNIAVDRRELEKEPGESEPALIYSPDAKMVGTYDAAFRFEEIQGVALPEHIARWVESVADEIHTFLYD